MLLPFFKALEKLAFSDAIRQSSWVGPAVNVAHLLCLVVLTGAIVVVDLRLLGRGMTLQPVSQVARAARPWLLGALLGMLLTGIPQLTSTAMKQYYNQFFWQKMSILLLTLIFTFTIRHKVTMASEGEVGPVRAKIVGLISLLLWSNVAIQGRLIGLLS